MLTERADWERVGSFGDQKKYLNEGWGNSIEFSFSSFSGSKQEKPTLTSCSVHSSTLAAASV